MEVHIGESAKVDIEIRSLLNAYPMLFKTREDALLHIFINSGYRWDDGCLVRIHPIDRDVNVMDLQRPR